MHTTTRRMAFPAGDREVGILALAYTYYLYRPRALLNKKQTLPVLNIIYFNRFLNTRLWTISQTPSF